MELNDQNMLVPLITPGKDGQPTMLTWSTKEYLQKFIAAENAEYDMNLLTNERDDVDSEALAQSDLYQETIRKNNAPSFGQRLFDVD